MSSDFKRDTSVNRSLTVLRSILTSRWQEWLRSARKQEVNMNVLIGPGYNRSARVPKSSVHVAHHYKQDLCLTVNMTPQTAYKVHHSFIMNIDSVMGETLLCIFIRMHNQVVNPVYPEVNPLNTRPLLIPAHISSWLTYVGWDLEEKRNPTHLLTSSDSIRVRLYEGDSSQENKSISCFSESSTTTYIHTVQYMS